LARKKAGVCLFRPDAFLAEGRVAAGHGATANVAIGSATREGRVLFPDPRRLVPAPGFIDYAIIECAANVAWMRVSTGVSAVGSWTACAA